MASTAAAMVTASAFPRPSTVSSFAFPSLPALILRNHRRQHGDAVSLLFRHRRPFSSFPAASLGTSVEQVEEKTADDNLGSSNDAFEFDFGSAVSEMKRVIPPAEFEIKELEELPEQWRRTKLAWLCKELPAHKAGTLARILNAQRKWMRQEDATYVAVHCMRIRENETGFKVYKWMMQQHWYRFDFALATKLADYLGKQRKFAKCREIFDDIINQGRVPSESTFHILIVSYLSSSIQGCLEDACDIYNRMIQLGGYQPQLILHNALFRALVRGPGGSSKHHLKQAEFIFHNLVTCGLDVHKDVYGGLIWLHSYQDTIDTERMKTLRKEMVGAGFQEGRDVLLSILRASSKVGDTEEAERAWFKLLHLGITVPPLAYIYRMEVYAKVGEYMKSLDIFREMKEHLGGSPTVAAYHEIIEVLCKAQDVELAESLMMEFMGSGLKPLRPSFGDLMNMYSVLDLHDKVESGFHQCLEKCQPDRTVYGIYLDSLVQVGNTDKAEEIFNRMQGDAVLGVSKRSCNSILGGYLSSGDNSKAEKIYHFMCQKKYDVEPLLMEKLNEITSSRAKPIKKPSSPKLSKDQREIMVGMLLGGLQIDSDERRRKHMVRFEFSETSNMHSVLKKHIYEQFHEWLHPSSELNDYTDEIPNRFLTMAHPYFGFYADQFLPNGQTMIPKLIHRWLSPFVLAYWYMYGGHRTSKGDVLLKLKGSRDCVERVVKSLKTKSLDCRVKRKGRIFWIGLLGNNSTLFWEQIEPYVLDCSSDSPEGDGETLGSNIVDDGDTNLKGGSDTENCSDYGDTDC